MLRLVASYMFPCGGWAVSRYDVVVIGAGAAGLACGALLTKHGKRVMVLERSPWLVGRYRPHWRAPNVDGLYFASETFRSRGIGIDRAARAGLTVAEEILGRRLPGFDATWRY
jgi:2-polyprenyl-6-methoxyphenol hydroxylase-like FAD-dependent oxidoreductase